MRIVMPRSRSSSIASSACSSRSRDSIVRVISSSRSESVVLPWSMCAMMQKLRTLPATSTRCGRSVFSATRRDDLEKRYAAVEDQMLQRGPDEQLQHEDDDQEGEVESPQRRDDTSDRNQDGLD